MNLLQQLLQIAWDTLVYWGAFLYLWLGRQPISSLEVFGTDRLPLCHMYMAAQTLLLWKQPHYRAPTFADDLRDNLKNVAIPGTGVPLSVFCYNQATALLFILVVNPIVSLVAAVYTTHFSSSSSSTITTTTSHGSQPTSVATAYRQLLLFPSHWFAIWRHNCLLVGYHALRTGSSSYALEAKGAFLLEGQRMGLPVSPFISNAAVFVKHVSVEGGMGIHVFRNFTQGGEWVIQPALSNSDELSRMLPPGAPLSTLRVVTASTAWTDKQKAHSYCGAMYGLGPWLQEQQQQQQYETADERDKVARQGRNGGTWRQSEAAASGSNSGMRSSSSSSRSRSRSRHSNNNNNTNNSSSEPVGAGGSSRPCRRSNRESSTPGSQAVVRAPGLPLSAAMLQQGGAAAAAQRGVNGVQQQWSSSGGSAAAGGASAAAAAAGQQQGVCAGPVHVVTAVWRAGLAGKDTDHASICFPLDPTTGLLSQGVSANHWYRLGWRWLGRVDTSTAGRSWLQHPDSRAQVAGVTLPGVQDIMRTVAHAHLVATPDVPLVGWDVALTPEGVFLLEMNLSCNLFNGHFDAQQFYQGMYECLEALDACCDADVSGAPHAGGR